MSENIDCIEYYRKYEGFVYAQQDFIPLYEKNKKYFAKNVFNTMYNKFSKGRKSMESQTLRNYKKKYNQLQNQELYIMNNIINQHLDKLWLSNPHTIWYNLSHFGAFDYMKEELCGFEYKNNFYSINTIKKNFKNNKIVDLLDMFTNGQFVQFNSLSKIKNYNKNIYNKILKSESYSNWKSYKNSFGSTKAQRYRNFRESKQFLYYKKIYNANKLKNIKLKNINNNLVSEREKLKEVRYKKEIYKKFIYDIKFNKNQSSSSCKLYA